MFEPQELISVGKKTTMLIGDRARWYAELSSEEEVEKACAFCKKHAVPLIVLGSGSNTVFADAVIEALVVRLKAESVAIADIEDEFSAEVTVEAGKNLAMLIGELAEKNIDLSALTGIPGTVGGAVFGNAGQGVTGTWMDSFVETVTAYVGGEWQTLTKAECKFRYRESWFKDQADGLHTTDNAAPVIWSVKLRLPRRNAAIVKAEIETLLTKRIETQPHVKTAGSCFKSLPDGTPAWKLIDEAGLRGKREGGVCISEKHANFLINEGGGTFADVLSLAEAVKRAVPRLPHIEMRLYDENGKIMRV